jgi:hypothetical protein
VSRSFGKVPPLWPSEYNKEKDIRVRNRSSMHQEMVNPDYGEVLFLIEKKLSLSWPSYRDYKCKKEIRNRYFLDIRNILNGYTDRYCVSWHEDFMDIFNCIRAPYSDDSRIYHFEWINSKKAKAVIKSWTGKPLDVLEYLTRCGLIEQAVRREFKKQTAK